MNSTCSKSIKVILSALMFSHVSFAYKNVDSSNGTTKGGGGNHVNVVGCTDGKAKTDLDVNNVRATILTGGDMWWDLTNPQYEVPLGSGLHSLFSGALWIGGTDAAGNIKVAAQTYRQTGNDMWPGAIDVNNISIDPSRCKKYDRHWKITKSEVFDFVYNGAPATKDIKEWPGNGDITFGEDFYLAPYIKRDTLDSTGYDANKGDYPAYNFSGKYPGNICNDYVFGDQTLWWVMNDVGNTHSETGGDQIGLEIRCQAFGFKTNDEVNNMTFYKYQIINRSNQSVNNTYFGVWVDPDLGKATDDYVGCDVRLGLGYVYNGDADDDGAGGYGLNPPACGVDFFQGPLADPNDGIDNNKNGVTDEPGEQIIMSKFLYYNNVNGDPAGNPSGAAHFYNYLKGIWGNGQVMTYGGNGRVTTNPPCNYMFPGLTDPDFPTTEWTEVTAGNTPEDRRFLQSAGKFTLQPGAINYITCGVVWSRAASGGPQASIDIMKLADAKAQSVFDNCFQVLDGPNAPNLEIRELDRQVILSLTNYNDSTVELYSQVDPTLPRTVDTITYTDEQLSYKFQGYILYQFKDATVTTSDIGNPDKVRTVNAYQCDLKDTIKQIVNNTWDDNLKFWVPKEMVNGNNQGIKHIFVINDDLFATGTTTLVNNKQYYFCIVSYAYNNFAPFVPSSISLNGTQSKPFFQGRNNIRTYTAIPHLPVVENNGQIFGSTIDSRPIMQRIEGQGNNGLILDMAQASLNEAITGPAYRSYNPIYEKDRSPVNIAVYDPVRVTSNNFEIKFDGVADSSNWLLTNTSNGKLTPSERTLGSISQQILGYEENDDFVAYGMYANIANVDEAGSPDAINNGYLDASIEYSDPNKKWIDFIADANGSSTEDWISSGKIADGTTPYPGIDDGKVYEKVLGGTWAPFKLCAKNKSWSPKWNNTLLDQPSSGLTMDKLASVDIIITSDQSKWTRSAVFEICNDQANTQPPGANAVRFNLRKSPSIDKGGNPATVTTPSDNPDDPNYINATGMGWFPGYAINVETGERLNIAYGENSCVDGDMKWNPSSVRYDPATGAPVFGGMHYIYVYGHSNDTPTDGPRYDACRWLISKISTGITSDKRMSFKDAMWVSCPMLKAGQSLLATDCKVRLRVARTFRQYDTRKDMFPGDQLSPNTDYKVLKAAVVYNGTTYQVGSTFTTDATNLAFTGYGSVVGGATYNNSNPYYKFSSEALANSPNNKETATDALQYINIVPNPYYAYSSYETNQVDNRVRITNLPPNCNIKILTLNGSIVKEYKRAAGSDNSLGATSDVTNTSTSLDWDLKNVKGIPVASGLYLIHVEAPGLGEKVLKFFCVMRPVDLDTY